MSALRRDLIERKLWMLVAGLVLAVVAVPVLLLNGGSADGAPTTPTPPAAAAPVSSTVPSAAAPVHAKTPAETAYVKVRRNPFAGQGSSTSTTASTTSTTSAAATPAASSASTAASSGATSTTAAMVSPSPSSTTPSSGATTPSASPSTHISSPPVSTTASVTPTPAPAPAKVSSWTMYSVSIRYGKDISVPLRANVARLTAFPSAASPEVMFLGVMTGGKQAVFALRAGLGHTGPGLCRPDHARCSAILLKPGQTEHITIPVTGGAPKQVVLRLVRITHRVTHSRKVALAGYLRYSAAGLCDLALADPVLYNLGTGTVSGMPKAVCQHQPKSVPFTPLVATP